MDDGSPIRLFIPLLLLLILSACFAACEMALSSVSRIRMMTYADDGDRRAKRVLKILDNFDKALVTLLIGNNIAHIGSAALATYITTQLWDEGVVAYSTIVMTIVVFLFAENLPKAYAKACNEKFAMGVAGPVLFVMKLFTPLSFLFSKISGLLSRPFRANVTEEPTVTEDELYDIIETIVEEGALDEDKSELMQNAIEFSERTAGDILVPWDKVLTVSLDMSAADILCVVRSCAHSRLPVTGADGSVLGVLHIRKYLKAYMAKCAVLTDIMDDAHFIRTDTPIDDLLPAMSANKTHLSIVMGLDGETLGVITVEDILEELVGEIYDEEDEKEAGQA